MARLASRIFSRAARDIIPTTFPGNREKNSGKSSRHQKKVPKIHADPNKWLILLPRTRGPLVRYDIRLKVPATKKRRMHEE